MCRRALVLTELLVRLYHQQINAFDSRITFLSRPHLRAGQAFFLTPTNPGAPN